MPSSPGTASFTCAHRTSARCSPIFRDHIAARGLLLFTSGPAHGEAIGEMYGQRLYYASLDAEEYRELIAANGFELLRHTVEDPQFGGHTVWLAQAA